MREESELAAEDRSDLSTIKEELARLRLATEHRAQFGSSEHVAPNTNSSVPPSSQEEHAANEAIQRLVQERSSLLQSGVYGMCHWRTGDILMLTRTML